MLRIQYRLELEILTYGIRLTFNHPTNLNELKEPEVIFHRLSNAFKCMPLHHYFDNLCRFDCQMFTIRLAYFLDS